MKDELVKILRDLIERYGEPWRLEFCDDFDLEEAEKVVDFFNNGGLELHNEYGENTAVVYVALVDGKIDLGCWLWQDGEDFDDDAEWHIFGPEVFLDHELTDICGRIEEIHKI